jgi:hypothetical protein
LLGADITAVNTLNDLGAYMARDDGSMPRKERVSFTVAKGDISTQQKEPIMAMTDEEKARVAALEDSVKKLSADNVQLTAKLSEKDAQEKVQQEAQAKARFTADSAAFKADLEAMVKDGRLTPAQRDALLVDAGTSEGLVLARAKAEFAAKAPGKPLKADDKAGDKDGKEDEGKTPDVILAGHVNKLMAEHPTMTFSAAKQAVMRGNPSLARDYIKLTG